MCPASPDHTPVQPTAPDAVSKRSPRPRFAEVQAVLEKLFELYPHLFGQRFLPLKLGAFQDLLAAHPDVFERQSLKAALGVHARSTAYLQSVASGTPRHDLQGQVVEPVALEHVFFAALELYHRRQARKGLSAQDQAQNQTRLRKQLLGAYEASGLSRADYLALLPAHDDVVARLLAEAMDQADQHRARQEALVRAYRASGQSVEAFASSLGMPLAVIQAALQSARD
jgi:ProP effector